MTIDRIAELRFTISAAVCVGVVLAIFVTSSMMVQIELSNWLIVNNSLVVLSFVPLMVIGFVFRKLNRPVVLLLGHCAIYALIVMFCYVGSYAAATYFFPEQLVWMPFFHRDYTHHGYTSVAEYMNAKDNYRDLLVLQIISCVITSVLYFVAGIIGYAAGSLSKGMDHS